MQPKSSASSSSSVSGSSNSEVQLEMVMDTEVTSSTGEVAEVSSAQSSSPGVMVSPWSPTGVEKVWYEFITLVKPGLKVEQVKELN